MAHKLKNLSAFPLDVPTMSGPAILPAYGEITAELSAFEADVLAQSPYVEISEAADKSAKPADDRDPDDLRAQYEELFGEEPDKRWGEKRLTAEIDKKLAE